MIEICLQVKIMLGIQQKIDSQYSVGL